MGRRSSLQPNSSGSAATDQLLGEAYKVVRNVEEHLPEIEIAAEGIGAINAAPAAASAAASSASAAAGSASVATTKASEASGSAATALTKANEAAASAAAAASDRLLSEAAAAVSGGLRFSWSGGTTVSNPTTGKLKVNHADLASATILSISKTDKNGADVGAAILSWDNSTSAIRAYLKLFKVGAPSNIVIYSIGSALTDNGSWVSFNLTLVSANGAFSSNDDIAIEVDRTGDAGTGAVDSINGMDGVVTIHTDHISDAGRTNKWATIAEKAKLAFLSITSALDLDALAASVAGILAKTNWITVTAATNLDTIRASVAGLGTAATRNTGTAAGQVPLLDGGGKLDTAVIPSLALVEPFVVANETAMLALVAQQGDIAIRTDINKSFVLASNSPSTLADWKELLTSTDAVLSVAGLTGAVSVAALKTALALSQSDISGLSPGDSPWFTALNIGHNTDTTITRTAAGRIAVEGSPVLLGSVEGQSVIGGATITPRDLGNLSGQSITPNPGNRAIQKVTNNGAGSILPGSNFGQYTLQVINAAGAGAITTTGWILRGDAFDTTATSRFVCSCLVTSDFSVMTVLKVA